jgi:riboflavin kinase/FMN adenylyltransferase
MRTSSQPEEIPESTIATVGTFDGVHLGHQAILRELRKRARKADSESLLITFDPPPPLYFHTTNSLLSTREEQIALLEENGLQNLLILKFTDEMVQMEPEDFVERVLVGTLKVKEVVIGKTHRFGRGKRGDFKLLKELGRRWGFRVDILSPVTYKQTPISSSRVRAALQKGEVDDVKVMLGKDYSFTGEVIRGVGRGKKLRYPTANLRVEKLKLLPANGVYAARVELEEKSQDAVMNIGTRPTFKDPHRSVEVHLLDFDQTIYGESLRIHCVKRLRNEKVFVNEELLRSQIERDLKTAKGLL